MISHFRKLIALPLALLLTLSLPSCDSLSYREAIQLYNTQKYEEAAELFAQLGDYEDSAQMISSCNYLDAVLRMEAGKYSEALPRFLKLGDYEDSVQRVLECRYQLAISAFEGGEYTQAEEAFLEIADYRQSGDYLRQINWQKFYDYIRDTGSAAGGSFVLSIPHDASIVNVFVDSADPGNIILSVSWEKDMGYLFRDELKLSVPRGDIRISFTANSSFTMNFNGSVIGSQQSAEGSFAIADWNAELKPVPETYQETVTDNQGNVTTSNGPADAAMLEQMQSNLAVIRAVFLQVLEESGLGITPADMGFESLA